MYVMAELTLETLLDSGMSLEDILFNREPVQVDVSVDTSNLVDVVKKTHENAISNMLNMKALIIENNNYNKDLLSKALSLATKQSSIPVNVPSHIQNEVTELNLVRNKTTRLLERIILVREK